MRRMGIGLGVGINRSNYAQGIFGAYATRVVADGGVVEAGSCVDAVSGLLLNASLLLIPSGYKGGKLYAEIPTNGNGDLTWTRGGTANRTNASGNIELMGANVPRLSYMYGSCPAVLAEPQRTNLSTYSEQFDNAVWIRTTSTVTANNTTSPDGTQNADLITFTSTTYASLYQAVTTTNGAIYTASIYAKKGNQNFLGLEIRGASSSTDTVFNLNTGVVVSGTGTIENVGAGWYRCSITKAANSTVTLLIIGRGNSGANNDTVYLYGAQLEAGAYPTTYIPTTSATATRVADSFSRNNIYTNGLITSSGGTWFVELRGNVAYTRDAGSEGIFIGDTSVGTTNCLQISSPIGGGRLRILKRVAGTGTELYSTLTDTIKVAIKWNGTSADVFVNGTKRVSATAYTTTNMEFLGGLSADVPKFIQQMALYPSPLSDTDCTTLTTL